MPAKKKWRIVYPGISEQSTFGSEGETYDFVDDLRHAWTGGAPTARLTVQVDEGLGAGWEPYEHIDFAQERL